MKNNVFLKVAASVLVCLFLFLAGGFCFWFIQKQINKEDVKASPSPQVQSPGTAVESDVETNNQAESPAASPVAVKSDMELLKEAFADKYNHEVSEIEINISKQSNPYISGGVIFEGEIGGGWFLAYKGSDGWIIVADGNGTIPCEAIEPYDFPTSMAPECFTQDGKIITR